jgi:lysophospholipase L1-like esterase
MARAVRRCGIAGGGKQLLTAGTGVHNDETNSRLSGTFNRFRVRPRADANLEDLMRMRFGDRVLFGSPGAIGRAFGTSAVYLLSIVIPSAIVYTSWLFILSVRQPLAPAPWSDDCPGHGFAVFRGVDFTKTTSLTVSLRADNPSVLFLMSDYSWDGFYCARLSTFPGMESSYFYFKEGRVEQEWPMSPLPADGNSYEVIWDSTRFPRPSRSLQLLPFPPPTDAQSRTPLYGIVKSFEIHGQDGAVRRTHFEEAPSVVLSALAGAVLSFFLFLVFDRRFLRRRYGNFRQYITIRRRIRIIRVVPGSVLALSFARSGFDFAVTLGLGTAVLAWCAVGAYPLVCLRSAADGARAERFWLPVALLGVLISIPLVLWTIVQQVGLNSITDDICRGGLAAKPGGKPVVFCMGSSSTVGIPFAFHNWRYSYPSLLEQRLSADGWTATVVNGGSGGTKTGFALKYLPGMMECLHPDLVTLNFMHNDKHFELFRGKRFLRRLREKLRREVELVHGHGAECAFIIEPTFGAVYKNADDFDDVRQLIVDVARQYGAFVIDPHAKFVDAKDLFLFVDGDVHLTRYGTQVMAEAIAPDIERILAWRARPRASSATLQPQAGQ